MVVLVFDGENLDGAVAVGSTDTSTFALSLKDGQDVYLLYYGCPLEVLLEDLGHSLAVMSGVITLKLGLSKDSEGKELSPELRWLPHTSRVMRARAGPGGVGLFEDVAASDLAALNSLRTYVQSPACERLTFTDPALRLDDDYNRVGMLVESTRGTVLISTWRAQDDPSEDAEHPAYGLYEFEFDPATKTLVRLGRTRLAYLRKVSERCEPRELPSEEEWKPDGRHPLSWPQPEDAVQGCERYTPIAGYLRREHQREPGGEPTLYSLDVDGRLMRHVSDAPPFRLEELAEIPLDAPIARSGDGDTGSNLTPQPGPVSPCAGEEEVAWTDLSEWEKAVRTRLDVAAMSGRVEEGVFRLLVLAVNVKCGRGYLGYFEEGEPTAVPRWSWHRVANYRGLEDLYGKKDADVRVAERRPIAIAWHGDEALLLGATSLGGRPTDPTSDVSTSSTANRLVSLRFQPGWRSHALKYIQPPGGAENANLQGLGGEPVAHLVVRERTRVLLYSRSPDLDSLVGPWREVDAVDSLFDRGAAVVTLEPLGGVGWMLGASGGLEAQARAYYSPVGRAMPVSGVVPRVVDLPEDRALRMCQVGEGVILAAQAARSVGWHVTHGRVDRCSKCGVP